MNWSSLHDFLAMGGHAAFVWPAYVLAMSILVALAVQSRAARKAAQRTVRAAEALRPAARRARQ